MDVMYFPWADQGLDRDGCMLFFDAYGLSVSNFAEEDIVGQNSGGKFFPNLSSCDSYHVFAFLESTGDMICKCHYSLFL